MVDRDRQHHGDRGVGDVGGVPGAAEADLDHGHVDGGVGEGGVRHRDDRLEERQRVRLARVDEVVYGATSLNAVTNCSSVSCSPSRLIRSVIRSTCGLVNRPVRSSSARSRVSIIRDVEVLPLVPVRWMTG